MKQCVQNKEMSHYIPYNNRPFL